MITLSNSQGLMFAEISMEEPKDVQSTSVKHWLGAQKAGQAKALLTTTVTACKGVVTHTVGEAVLSSFPGVGAAVKAALEVQRKLAESQGGAAGPVRLRVGLSFGPIRVMAGKVSGDAVASAGMLLELAKPGEILADLRVKEALSGSTEVAFETYDGGGAVVAFRVVGRPSEDTQSRTQHVAPRPELADSPALRPAAPAKPATPPAPARNEPSEEATQIVRRAGAASALILRYRGAEQRFTSSDGEVAIGRALENQVNVPVLHVSRRHAKIVWEDLQPFLVNLSQNGTCVKYDETGRVQPCVDDKKVPLQGNGAIALAADFRQSATGADVVKFSVVT